MLVPLLVSAVVLPVLAAPAKISPPQSSDLLDARRAALVAHLADRSSRELAATLEAWRAASGSAKAELEARIADLAAERRGYLVEAMARAPEVAWMALLSGADRADVDSIAPGNTAQPVAVTGTLGVAFAGADEAASESGPLHELDDGEGTVRSLRVALGALEAAAGSVLEVDGHALDGELLTAENAVTTLLEPSAPELEGVLKFLCVFVRLNGVAPNNNKSSVQNVLELGGVNSVEYYAETSFGLVTLAYEYVAGVVEINVGPANFCNHNMIRDAVIQELEAAPGGFAQENYYGISIFIDWTDPPGEEECPFFNRASVGQQQFLVGNESYNLATMWLSSSPLSLHSTIHEVGHTLGCNHASRWDCESLTSPGFGEGSCFCEYGDPISCMGGSNAGPVGVHCVAKKSGVAHLNGLHKHETGDWIDAALVQDTFAPSSSVIYELYPIGFASVGASSANNKRQLLKLTRGDLGALYVEFRRAIPGSAYEVPSAYTEVMGADGSLKNVGAALLYVQPLPNRSATVNPFLPPEGHIKGSCLTHLALPGFTNTFTDSCTGASVTVLGLTENEPPRLRVRVQTGPTVCNDVTRPTVTVDEPLNGAQVQGVITVTATAEDLNGITDIEFMRFSAGPEQGLTSIEVVPVNHTGPGPQTKSISFDTRTIPNGAAGFLAVARDMPAGCCPNRAVSAPVRVNVVNPLGPLPFVVVVGPPAGGATISPFLAETDASASSGVAAVEYFFDPSYADPCGAGELHDGAHPESCAYHQLFPAFSEYFPEVDGGRGAFLVGTGDDAHDLLVSSLPPGSYVWWPRAISNSGESVVGEARTLTIQGENPFDITIGFDEGAIFSAGATVAIPTTLASDAGEVGHVDFFVDGVFLARDLTAPYSADWVVPAGSASHLLRADAFGLGGRTASDGVTVQVP